MENVNVEAAKGKGGAIRNIVRGIGAIVKAFLGKLSTRDLYWSLVKYLGEALGIALFKTIGEVLFGMSDVLRGESSWYGRKEADRTPNSNQSNYGGYGAFSNTSNYRSNYSNRSVPATTNQSSGFGSTTDGLSFQGFAN